METINLSKNCENKLKQWLYKLSNVKHDSDLDKFYEFIDSYYRDHGFYRGELKTLIETIIELNSSYSEINKYPKTDLVNIIEERVILMYYILDFLQTIK